MGVVRKTLYLSKRYDEDLISLLSQVGTRTFILFLKDALRGLTRPGYTPTAIGKKVITPKKFGKCEDGVLIQTTFSDVKDGDVISLLSSVKKGKTSLFLKTALRLSLGTYYSLGYYLNGNEALCDAFASKGIFFIQTDMPVQSVAEVKKSPRRPKKNKDVPRESAVRIVPAPEPVREPEPIPVPCIETVPITAENNGGDLSEDDILALLEGM